MMLDLESPYGFFFFIFNCIFILNIYIKLEEQFSEGQQELVESAAEMLYGLFMF